MENKKDNPRVYIPPPLFYAGTFLAAIFIQKKIPINDSVFHLTIIKILGGLLFAIALFFLVRSLKQFLRSKNTLVTFKPATTLQKNDIYNITRNPMYMGLAIVYLGVTCFIGNW